MFLEIVVSVEVGVSCGAEVGFSGLVGFSSIVPVASFPFAKNAIVLSPFSFVFDSYIITEESLDS
jgi:hypothetical protein